MARKYKKSEKPHKKYDPGKLEQAIAAIKGGSSLRKTAQEFGIHRSVLFRHVKKGSLLKTQGGQRVLSETEEETIVKNLLICAKWGYPITPFDLRVIVKKYLDDQKRTVTKFRNNFPGKDFAYSFLNRHKASLSTRLCQNIKRSRSAVSRTCINEYFNSLEEEIQGVPPENIVNYDETNLCDDPGQKKIITKRGCKYPERVMNSSKASTSVMFAAAGDGTILPPYVVYRAAHLYESWRTGGPEKSRYNRTKSGWFDTSCFDDWVRTVALPYLKNKDGKKVLIGDNLSSHLSVAAIEECEKYGVVFIFLPANSTHLTQPLDVSFFHPLKVKWRSILESWKMTPAGRHASSVPKDVFPRLLKNLMSEIRENGEENVKSGFRKCGIVPLNREEVLRSVPAVEEEVSAQEESINTSFEDFLKIMRFGDEGQTTSERRRPRRTRIPVAPGRSVGVPDEEESDESDHDDPMESSAASSDNGGDDSSSKDKDVDAEVDASDAEVNASDAEVDASDAEVSDAEEDADDVGTNKVKTATYVAGQWVIVRFETDTGKKKPQERYRYYVGQIITLLGNGEFRIKFARKYGLNRFKWPIQEDIDDVPVSDIHSVLPDPEFEGNKVSRATTFHFDARFEGIKIF